MVHGFEWQLLDLGLGRCEAEAAGCHVATMKGILKPISGVRTGHWKPRVALDFTVNRTNPFLLRREPD